MENSEEKFRWTPKLTYELIEAIKRHPCLWCKDDSDYLNNDAKRAAHVDISISINVPENDVRYKIRILRIIFLHVHRKHKRSGMTPKWRYYKRLLFLVDPSSATLTPSPLFVPIPEKIEKAEKLDKPEKVKLPEKLKKPEKKQLSEKTEVTEEAELSEEDLEEPDIISTDTELNPLEDWCEVKLLEGNVIAANEKFGRYVVESINTLEDIRLMKRTKARIKLLISEVLAERAMSQLAECEAGNGF